MRSRSHLAATIALGNTRRRLSQILFRTLVHSTVARTIRLDSLDIALCLRGHRNHPVVSPTFLGHALGLVYPSPHRIVSFSSDILVPPSRTTPRTSSLSSDFRPQCDLAFLVIARAKFSLGPSSFPWHPFLSTASRMGRAKSRSISPRWYRSFTRLIRATNFDNGDAARKYSSGSQLRWLVLLRKGNFLRIRDHFCCT